MAKQEGKIKQLYESGILTHEEMEVELRKLKESSKNVSKTKKVMWWCVGVIILLSIGIIAFVSPNKSNSDKLLCDGKPQWGITNIEGTKAIQIQFHNNEYGILQVAYCPEKGFRFGLFDTDLNQKPFQLPNHEYALIGFKEKGEDFPMMMPQPKKDNNYIYYDKQWQVDKFVDILNSDKAEFLTIEWINEDGSHDDSLDYQWYVNLQPGEFYEKVKTI